MSIGKYRVVAHIATGGMGAVYKAEDPALGREVALKVLPPEMAANEEAVARFRREARNAARLRHDNIVTLYEFSEDKGTYFLAMEFVQGIDLQQYITRKKQLGIEEACEILRQALVALKHAHTESIVHRDIKPSNFLLTRRENHLLVKLADFGLARKEHDEECRVTRAGTTVGTVDYISPEQARDSSSADIRSDIYSLGCTLYHMLSGKPPFPEGSMTERLYKHIEAQPPDIRTLNPRVPPWVAVLLERMLAKRPEDRYQTPQDALDDLARREKLTQRELERDVLAGLMPAAPKPARRPAARNAPGDSIYEVNVNRHLPDAFKGPPPRERDDEPEMKPFPWLLVIIGVLLLALVGVSLVLALRTARHELTPPVHHDETPASSRSEHAPGADGDEAR